METRRRRTDIMGERLSLINAAAHTTSADARPYLDNFGFAVGVSVFLFLLSLPRSVISFTHFLISDFLLSARSVSIVI